MRSRILIFLILLVGPWGQGVGAQEISSGNLRGGPGDRPQGVIVRTNLHLLGLQNLCLLAGCKVVEPVDGTLGEVFLLAPPLGLDPNTFAAILRLLPGILDAEIDRLLSLVPATTLTAALPKGLMDSIPVNYYGSVVWDGYAHQPAAELVHVSDAHSEFDVGGAGVVADIDTGVDPNHPALQGVLLPGYDFTRNHAGGSEMADLTHPVNMDCNPCQAAYVNQSTAAMLDQSTAAMLDGTPYASFGHGTMVAGVIHLVAPTARIMPLKTFYANGSGYLSDIVRAIYYAVQNHAHVINMSFDLRANSYELSRAIHYSAGHNVINVASAGNDGRQEKVYPAGLANVMGVASTNDFGQRSNFSNYGDQIVWVAAPGEGIITTYPFGTYAAGWGTSFSSPFVAGTASLLVNLQPYCGQTQAAAAVSHAQWIGAGMGNGLLNIESALSAFEFDSN
jgi:subtilisin family serine protease